MQADARRAEAEHGLRFRVLGPLAAERAGHLVLATGRRELLLLAALLAHRNEVVPVTRLTRLIWGADGEPSRNALQARVSHLRRALALEPDRLVFAGDGYRLAVGTGDCDDDALADAVGHAQALLGAGMAHAARDLLGPALADVRGEPYAPVGDQPFAVAAATRARDLIRSARELHAMAVLEAGDAATAGAMATALVIEQPLRQDAVVVLMRALDAQDRRAEALSTYDQARRRLAATTGLEPSAGLRAAHADILRTERAQSRSAAAGPGVLEPPEMITWLAGNGHLDAALHLAVRCAWGWWLAGDRGRGRRLLLDLLAETERSTGTPSRATRAARLWAAALAGHERDEPLTFTDTGGSGPADPDAIEALAMVLLADRRTERGEHDIARTLLEPARAALAAAGDRWGQAMADLVTARQHLLSGAVEKAESTGREILAVFHDLADPAGQLASLDLLGSAAEAGGDWYGAADHHRRALLLALHGGWPHAQCLQTMRLGSTMVLSGQVEAGRRRLDEALAIARRLDSPSLLAFARNHIALADARAGDTAAAARGHHLALDWYRRAGSLAGIAFTAAALARVGPRPRAETLLSASWDAAVRTRDPRAVAFTAESRALLTPDRDSAAVHLGLADGLRDRTGRPRAAGEQPAIDRLSPALTRLDSYRRGLRDAEELGRHLSDGLRRGG